MRTRHLATALAVLLAIPQPGFAYLKNGFRIGGRQVSLKWNSTPTYYVSVRSSVPGVAVTDFEAAVARAFAKWEAVPTASVTFRYGGVTVGLPGQQRDNTSTLGFDNRPELDRVLASTSYSFNIDGSLIESDIFFNSSFQWSVAPNGEANKFDLESIALHEIGHFSGLGHSALGETELREGGGRRVLSAESVMFPIAFAAGSIALRTLKPDDIAGISDLYPAGDFSRLGSLSGRVTKNGTPLFAAHIIAFDPATRELVASFTLNAQGEFTIAGLSPGPKIVRVEPLDDADISSFFDTSTGVDIDFRVLLFDKLVVVPSGGDSGSIQLAVTSK